MGARKAAFWLAVAGVAVIANFAMELASDKVPSEGLRSLVRYIHRGPSGGQA